VADFSVVNWILKRRGAYRDKYRERPIGLRVSPEIMRRIKQEHAELVGPEYARLVGRGSLFYGMVLQKVDDLKDDEIEFYS
jgi:hypothetical protein